MKERDKGYFREMVWTAMLETGAARSKQVHARIPDFYGNEEAARLVFRTACLAKGQGGKEQPGSTATTAAAEGFGGRKGALHGRAPSAQRAVYYRVGSDDADRTTGQGGND